MKKNLIVAAAAVLMAAALFVGNRFFSSQENSIIPGVASGKQFSQSGLIIRNTGFTPKPDTWYLFYDNSDQSGAIAELVLTSESLCTYAAQGEPAQRKCLEGFDMHNAAVTVTGAENNGLVNVKTIVQSGAAYPSAESEFTNSAVFSSYGTATVKGYVNRGPVCNEGGCDDKQTYIGFVVTGGANDALQKFIDNAGLGIGCLQGSRISYLNDSDQKGMVSKSISGEQFASLMASTKDRPVELKVTKYPITTGKGAPECYSQFYDFQVL